MPIVARVDPKTVFAPAEWSRLTSRSSLRAMWLVVHAWGPIAAVIALVTLWPNPLTWLIAVTVVGARQLGLAIPMHEAAHGGLHANKAVNEWIGQWLCAVPVGADLASYRSYHLQHHKFTQQPEDPDLSLSAPFPITKDSFTRKAIRDLTGQTFVNQRLPLLLSLFPRKGADDTESDESFPFSHARTTLAGPIERLLIAPYWVNFHAEHHLFMYLPCYRLPGAPLVAGAKTPSG